MTERPSQNKQILTKLDEIVSDINDVKVEVSSIKKQIDMQPRIDNELHKAIDGRINGQENRIKRLEDNQRWVVIAVIGTVLNALLQLVLR